ncbi:putative aldouronate transport system substrate-binding protein [Paenibacillus sp. UNCCL117]|uniref:ABC transporter substrate-binding protein n=1 Tax=unclassified Paenibacillus TaxID=185978 RepID=UPI0008809096|nr:MULTISPECIES: ABC transporter substrate-binding protein [unclassified Paenibacillus]SDD03745.1 carbohydrate ABC transporter substrate-binding protein, CUT1 family [Paenibacillus sp. cl123]SFW32240.1 putative aldouronate transport system substrate-binding protein [Paenibacillus sp. UNCCL117]
MGKRRWSSLCMTAMMSLSLVMAGCNSKSEGTPASASPEAPGKEAKQELPPYVIDWYIIGTSPQPDNALVEAEINKIVLPQINATVKMHIIPFGDYDSKMTALLATGEKVDLMFTSNGNMNYSALIAKGGLVDLTDKLDKLAPDAKKLLSEGFLQASAIKGKTYTLAAYKEKGSWLGFIANKTLMEKYSIDITKINSLEEMEPALKIIKDNEPTITPLLASGGAKIPFVVNRHLWNASPVQSIVLKKDGSAYTLVPDEPEYVASLKTLHRFFQAGYLRKDSAVLKITNDDRVKSAFSFSQLKPYVDVQVSNSYGAPFIYHHFGKPITTTNDLVGSMMGIPTTSKDPDRVLMFYNMMYKDEKLINLVGRGIEGKHYVKKSDKRIEFAPDTDNGKKSGYNPGTTWAYGNQYLTYLMPGEPDDIWEQFKKFNSESEVVPNLGFNFDSSNLKTEVAAIKNAENEFRPTLETGSVNPDEYLPKFKEKLKAAGIDKVLQEINKQYAEWRAENKK